MELRFIPRAVVEAPHAFEAEELLMVLEEVKCLMGDCNDGTTSLNTVWTSYFISAATLTRYSRL